MCLSHLIYTVRPCLIHTCHAAPMPCSNHAVLLKATAQHGRRETAVLYPGLEKNGKDRAWQWHGMASVNQTRPHCVNQMVKTHYKRLAARHVMCESALILPYSVQTTSRLSCTLKLEALGSLATLLLAINLIDATFRKTIIVRSSQRIYLDTFIQK